MPMEKDPRGSASSALSTCFWYSHVTQKPGFAQAVGVVRVRGEVRGQEACGRDTGARRRRSRCCRCCRGPRVGLAGAWIGGGRGKVLDTPVVMDVLQRGRRPSASTSSISGSARLVEKRSRVVGRRGRPAARVGRRARQRGYENRPKSRATSGPWRVRRWQRRASRWVRGPRAARVGPIVRAALEARALRNDRSSLDRTRAITPNATPPVANKRRARKDASAATRETGSERRRRRGRAPVTCARRSRRHERRRRTQPFTGRVASTREVVKLIACTVAVTSLSITLFLPRQPRPVPPPVFA